MEIDSPNLKKGGNFGKDSSGIPDIQCVTFLNNDRTNFNYPEIIKPLYNIISCINDVTYRSVIELFGQ